MKRGYLKIDLYSQQFYVHFPKYKMQFFQNMSNIYLELFSSMEEILDKMLDEKIGLKFSMYK